MNWGFKIGIVFVSFVVFMISMVTICMRQKNIHLVTENYYEKEIAYQDQIDNEANTAALKEEVPEISYAKENGVVTVRYPAAFSDTSIKGSILFFRPSDANQDFAVPLKASAYGQQEVSVANLTKGLWKIKMEWSAIGKNYYLEESLVVL